MKIYCYSKCSTCSKAIKLLKDLNLNFTVIDLVKNTPSENDLKEIYGLGDIDIDKYFNNRGKVFKELDLKNKLKNLSVDEKIKLLVTNGLLIKKPMLVTNDKVLLGFNEIEYKNLKK